MPASLLTPPSARVARAGADASATMNDELAQRLAAARKSSRSKAASAARKKAAKRRAKARAKAKAKKKLPVCTAKDLKKKKSKRRKCRLVKKAPIASSKPVSSPTGPVAAPPVTAPTPDAWTPLPTPIDQRVDGLPRFEGTFGPAQATRLLFRAGFGPLPGQAEEFASIGLQASVARLMNPPAGRGSAAALAGPAPTGNWLVGGQFAPVDRWNHGSLQFFDRMVRSTDQLGERMTMVLHDWIAISAGDVGARAMLASIETLRGGWRGSFRQLMLDMTIDPAMLQWLSGLGSDKRSPNENYAREIMELFCLGADRGAYTEADVRELARAFTGWRADWNDAVGLNNFRFDPKRWDAGEKVVFAGTPHEKRGPLDWRSAVAAVIDHPMHPSFVALKLWGAFIPTPPTPATLAELEGLYRSSGERLEPLVEAILLHPDLYSGPSVTKAPVTFAAGLLRARGRGLKEDAWSWILEGAGQQPWFPPNVSGWNERAWLNTTTYAARWQAAIVHLREGEVKEADYKGSTETPEQAVASALAFWGNPVLTDAHRAALLQHARDAMTAFYWNNTAVQRTMRQNTLRMLVVAAPDHQVS